MMKILYFTVAIFVIVNIGSFYHSWKFLFTSILIQFSVLFYLCYIMFYFIYYILCFILFYFILFYSILFYFILFYFAVKLATCRICGKIFPNFEELRTHMKKEKHFDVPSVPIGI